MSESEEESAEGDSEMEEEEHPWQVIDKIVSSRKGKLKGRNVVYYRCKYLDGTPMTDNLKDHVSSDAFDEFRLRHPNSPFD